MRCPRRLEAQDTGFSSRRRGFESRRGYMTEALELRSSGAFVFLRLAQVAVLRRGAEGVSLET